eukprot:05724_2
MMIQTERRGERDWKEEGETGERDTVCGKSRQQENMERRHHVVRSGSRLQGRSGRCCASVSMLGPDAGLSLASAVSLPLVSGFGASGLGSGLGTGFGLLRIGRLKLSTATALRLTSSVRRTGSEVFGRVPCEASFCASQMCALLTSVTILPSSSFSMWAYLGSLPVAVACSLARTWLRFSMATGSVWDSLSRSLAGSPILRDSSFATYSDFVVSSPSSSQFSASVRRFKKDSLTSAVTKGTSSPSSFSLISYMLS